ncbi:MAG: hypothetical protein ABI923_09660 [bacterium]
MTAVRVQDYFFHDEEYAKEFDKKTAEGVEFGKKTDQRGCIEEGLARAKKVNNPSTKQRAVNSVFVEKCLKSSQAKPGFCDHVPYLQSTDWKESQCTNAGWKISDNLPCWDVFEEQFDFCKWHSSK